MPSIYYSWFRIGNCRIFGPPIFQGRPEYTQITTIYMHLLIEIRHVRMQWPWELYWGEKKFNCILEIYIFRNSLQRFWVSWRVDFWGFGCPKDAQTPCLLAETMLLVLVAPDLIKKLSGLGWGSYSVVLLDVLVPQTCCWLSCNKIVDGIFSRHYWYEISSA